MEAVKSSNKYRDIKVVVVGDGAIGKTCLLIRYCEEKFSVEYVPTVFDNRKKEIKYRGESVSIKLWDTAGQEEYDRLRPLSYVDTDVFILVFSVVDRTSFENVSLKWKDEVIEYLGKGKMILAGTKVDLREDPDTLKALEVRKETPVTKEEGEKLKEYLGAYAYVETSSLHNINIDELFIACFDSMFKEHESTKKNGKAKGSGGGGGCLLL